MARLDAEAGGIVAPAKGVRKHNGRTCAFVAISRVGVVLRVLRGKPIAFCCRFANPSNNRFPKQFSSENALAYEDAC